MRELGVIVHLAMRANVAEAEPLILRLSHLAPASNTLLPSLRCITTFFAHWVVMARLRVSYLIDFRIYGLDSFRSVLPLVHIVVEFEIAFESLPLPIAHLKLLPFPEAALPDRSTEHFITLADAQVIGPTLRPHIAQPRQRLPLLSLLLLHLLQLLVILFLLLFQ